MSKSIGQIEQEHFNTINSLDRKLGPCGWGKFHVMIGEDFTVKRESMAVRSCSTIVTNAEPQPLFEKGLAMLFMPEQSKCPDDWFKTFRTDWHTLEDARHKLHGTAYETVYNEGSLTIHHLNERQQQVVVSFIEKNLDMLNIFQQQVPSPSFKSIMQEPYDPSGLNALYRTSHRYKDDRSMYERLNSEEHKLCRAILSAGYGAVAQMIELQLNQFTGCTCPPDDICVPQCTGRMNIHIAIENSLHIPIQIIFEELASMFRRINSKCVNVYLHTRSADAARTMLSWMNQGKYFYVHPLVMFADDYNAKFKMNPSASQWQDPSYNEAIEKLLALQRRKPNLRDKLVASQFQRKESLLSIVEDPISSQRSQSEAVVEGPVAPRSEVVVEGPVAPRSEVVVERLIAPHSEVVVGGPVAPRSEVVVEGSVAPRSEVVVEGPVAPRSEVVVEGPVAPRSEVAVKKSVAQRNENAIKEPVLCPCAPS